MISLYMDEDCDIEIIEDCGNFFMPVDTYSHLYKIPFSTLRKRLEDVDYTRYFINTLDGEYYLASCDCVSQECLLEWMKSDCPAVYDQCQYMGLNDYLKSLIDYRPTPDFFLITTTWLDIDDLANHLGFTAEEVQNIKNLDLKFAAYVDKQGKFINKHVYSGNNVRRLYPHTFSVVRSARVLITELL